MRISDFTGPAGVVIPSSNATLYIEHFIYTALGSKARNGDTNPPLGPGWYPDGLIPVVDPDTGADLHGALDAMPFALSSGEYAVFWVDVYVPEGTPAGLYEAQVTVESAQGSASSSVRLHVWNFTLPQTRSLKGFTNTFGAYRNLQNAAILLEHRISPKIVDPNDERFLIDTYNLDMVALFPVSGASHGSCYADSPPSLQAIEAERARHQTDLYLLNSYANEVWDCTALTDTFLGWSRVLRQGGVHPMIVTYPTDALLTSNPAQSAADIWSLLPKHYEGAKNSIQQALLAGNEVWSYNPLVQEGYSPKFTLDFSAVNARIMQGFINQALGFTGLKFWRVDNWPADPWNSVEATRADMPGEGHMVYPGDMVGLPNRIIPGMRLKWHREGSEDYEYLALLRSLGYSAFADDVIASVAADFIHWQNDPQVLEAARSRAGGKLHAHFTAHNSVCQRKSEGDADCNGALSLSDYEIWRREYLAGCSDSLSGNCGADEDGDGNGMDANFDFPLSGSHTTDDRVTIVDYEIWRRNYLHF